MTRPPTRLIKRWEKGGRDRVPAFIENWSRKNFYALGILLVLLVGLGAVFWWPAIFFGVLPLAYWVVGLKDISQKRHTVLRNFPLLGHLRYFFESVRPEIRQYFVESDFEQTPYSRAMRSVVYQRAKNALDTIPFGTKHDVYGDGYEWIAQSLVPTQPDPSTARVLIGEGRCQKPYSASLFNISAMSYGSLSHRAVLALNGGAKIGKFYHNTGEGGVARYHLEPGGDLVWQVGTGYFGCRSKNGGFDEGRFKETCSHKTVKMIELKLSQGAKPAHGGILPGKKVTPEIAEIRGVEVGKTVHSPPFHRAFSTPIGLLKFVTQMRELAGGIPVGVKLCVGQPHEFLAIVKAMLDTGMRPDFISVDGGEGGTGAAPVEFSNSVGMPLRDGLWFVHNALLGAGVRQDIKLISAGKIASGFHICRQLALGADLCNSARSMMFALGCIQALKCNSNKCPVGVATQVPKLVQGLDVDDKSTRVASYHFKTIEALLELVGAAGLDSPEELRPHHIYRRCSTTTIDTLDAIYPVIQEGSLLGNQVPAHFTEHWNRAAANSFRA